MLISKTARSLKDTTSWTEPRTLSNLPAFLKKKCGKLEPTAAKPAGAPHTLVVTASGIRAADVFRSLKEGLPKQGVKKPTVAKLFAKHMKVAEQVEHLKKNKSVALPCLALQDDARRCISSSHHEAWLT